MSQQILSFIQQINLRLDALEKAIEALAVRETTHAATPSPASLNDQFRAYMSSPEGRAELAALQVKRGPGRPPKQAAEHGTG